jgi:hypothetical protein
LLTAEVQRQPAVWSGAASGGLAVRPDALLQAGIDVREVPLEDAAVRAAILTDAAVRIVSGDEPDQPADGISALCRFTA